MPVMGSAFVECWEARPQALCTSEVRSFVYTLLKGGFAWKDVSNAATHASYTPLMAWRIVLYAVRTWASKAGGSVVHYCSSYTSANLRAVSCCKHTWALFVVKCRNTWMSTHPPLWQACKVPHPWALFRDTMVHVHSNTGNTKPSVTLRHWHHTVRVLLAVLNLFWMCCVRIPFSGWACTPACRERKHSTL